VLQQIFKMIKVLKTKVNKVKMNVIRIFKKIILENRRKRSLNKVISIGFKVVNQLLLPVKLMLILRYL
jgi:hypothetical protein